MDGYFLVTSAQSCRQPEHTGVKSVAYGGLVRGSPMDHLCEALQPIQPPLFIDSLLRNYQLVALQGEGAKVDCRML